MDDTVQEAEQSRKAEVRDEGRDVGHLGHAIVLCLRGPTRPVGQHCLPERDKVMVNGQNVRIEDDYYMDEIMQHLSTSY